MGSPAGRMPERYNDCSPGRQAREGTSVMTSRLGDSKLKMTFIRNFVSFLYVIGVGYPYRMYQMNRLIRI